MLHIRCGDDIRDALAAAEIPGDFVRWADPLCQGPLPADLRDEARREVRAQFISAQYGHEPEATRRFLAEQDAALERWRGQDEVVLWFEHDLFDQAILVYLLDWFAALDLEETALSLVSVGEFPGIARFIGLGQLSPAQLATLFRERRPVSPAQQALAGRAWAALCDPDPRAVEALLAQGAADLPHLAGALHRHLQDFPAVATGLARTQELILEAVSQGASDPVEAFLAVQELEERPWLGDEMFWPWLAGLAEAPVPALAIDAPPDWPQRAPDLRGVDLRLTRAGHQLFYGELDWIAANGIDRWLGGVHLQGTEARWRWDPRRGRLAGAGR